MVGFVSSKIFKQTNCKMLNEDYSIRLSQSEYAYYLLNCFGLFLDLCYINRSVLIYRYVSFSFPWSCHREVKAYCLIRIRVINNNKSWWMSLRVKNTWGKLTHKRSTNWKKIKVSFAYAYQFNSKFLQGSDTFKLLIHLTFKTI